MKLEAKRRPQETCAFCKDTLDGELEACAGCQTQYHFECLVDELDGACAVLGCGTRRAAPISISTADLTQCVDCGRGFVNETPRTCPRCNARYHLDCVRLRGGECGQDDCRGRVNTRTRTPLTPAQEERYAGVRLDPINWRHALQAVGGVFLVVATALAMTIPTGVGQGGIDHTEWMFVCMGIGFLCFLLTLKGS